MIRIAVLLALITGLAACETAQGVGDDFDNAADVIVDG
ncbi:hypothetical protein PARPLA_02070 [Rhodobacteraceae bacterium THAF1]|nr:entericidin, EcnA/B family [Palleronia sp. THAF1]QFU07783.1 hypothetical protein FIU81_03750 [Palleronia sp. THAF1]VDC25598.1 hypothetical protein PARPLA_02070 [Rhodobacteraceae bacterium THAF1]